MSVVSDVGLRQFADARPREDGFSPDDHAEWPDGFGFFRGLLIAMPISCLFWWGVIELAMR